MPWNLRGSRCTEGFPSRSSAGASDRTIQKNSIIENRQSLRAFSGDSPPQPLFRLSSFFKCGIIKVSYCVKGTDTAVSGSVSPGALPCRAARPAVSWSVRKECLPRRNPEKDFPGVCPEIFDCEPAAVLSAEKNGGPAASFGRRPVSKERKEALSLFLRCAPCRRKRRRAERTERKRAAAGEGTCFFLPCKVSIFEKGQISAGIRVRPCRRRAKAEGPGGDCGHFPRTEEQDAHLS